MKYKIDSIKKERIYQNTACLVLMKAIVDEKGMDVNVRVGNSLNQGFFIYIDDTDAPILSGELLDIKRRMDRLVSRDVEISTELTNNEEAVKLCIQYDVPEKQRLLEARAYDEPIKLCEIDGYRNCFYGDVLPSAGYLECYELRSYRNGFLLRLPNMLNPDSIPEYRDDEALYNAYADAKEIRKTTGIDYLADLNNAIRNGRGAEIIEKSEALQQKEINSLAQRIVNDGRRFVLIAGPSSSGKTTFAKRLCSAIEALSSKPIYIGTDDYFVEREFTPIGEDGKLDFEAFETLDIRLFNEQMEALMAGRPVDAPVFDFISGRKEFGRRIIKPDKDQTFVIEGIHSLNDRLTENIPTENKYKIYISPLTKLGIDRHNRISTTDARLLRRLVRDYQFRGKNASETIEQWPSVRRGENTNIFPYSSSADYVFNSSLVYETALLKAHAHALLEEIGEADTSYEEAQRLIEFLKYFEPISDSKAIPEYSLLREFIGTEQ